ncbi:MAG TPA: hypothetical protein RMH26_28065 [Polyangiaceae bacterium LLY-WYZ-15_(1-7)]|nr:hypothetical protein [Polyangiaceae bacterium LLY-WYZ-15_(1-7)]
MRHLLFASLVLAAACASQEELDQTRADLAAKSDEVETLRAEVQALRDEVDQLRQRVETMESQPAVTVTSGTLGGVAGLGQLGGPQVDPAAQAERERQAQEMVDGLLQGFGQLFRQAGATGTPSMMLGGPGGADPSDSSGAGWSASGMGGASSMGGVVDLPPPPP